MNSLILKDFQLLRFVNIIMLIVVGLFTFVGMSIENAFFSQLFFSFLIFLFTYAASMFLSVWESKTKGDIILNSLPVKRNDIVKARYLTVLIYTLVASFIVFLLSNLVHIFMATEFRGNPSSIFTIFLSIGINLLFFTFYLPFQYYSIGKVQIFNGIFYMLLILAPNFLSKYREFIMKTSFFKYISSLNFVPISFVFLIIAVLFYIFSFVVSINIYRSKEF